MMLRTWWVGLGVLPLGMLAACGSAGGRATDGNQATSALDGGAGPADPDAAADAAAPPPPVVDPCGPQGAPWAMSGRCPSRSGASPATGPATGTAKRWIRAIDGSPTEAVIGRDGTLYVGTAGAENALWAIGSDGAVKWTFRSDKGWSQDHWFSVGAIGWDDTVHVVADDNRLYAVDHTTGAKKWATSVGWGGKHTFEAPALAPDGTLYYASSGTLYAIAADGAQKWTYNAPTTNGGHGSLYAPTLAADGTVVVGREDGTLHAVKPTDGSVKWIFATNGAFAWAAPTVDANGNTYAFATDGMPGSRNVRLVAVDATGAQKWAMGFPGAGTAGAVALGTDRVYAVAGRALHALDESGHVQWSYSAPGDILGRPIVDAAGSVYLSVQYTGVVALASNGAVKYTVDLQDVTSGPVLGADGTMYVGSSNVDENGAVIGSVLAILPQ